jgi:hypothetical protein
VDIKELVAQVKSIKSDEKEELYRVLFEDEELLENLLDYAAMLQAEAEGGEPVTLEEYLAGKRTYGS